MSKRTFEKALPTPPTSPNPSFNSSPRSAGSKAKAARGRRRASSVPLPDSDSDEDLEPPAQRQRITFTPFSTPSTDKAAQLDGGDRTADLIDRPALGGASASRGSALGTVGKGAQEDLAESASGNEVVLKSEVIKLEALAAEQAKKIAELEATIAEMKKEDAKKVMEVRSLRTTIALGKTHYKDCARGNKNGAAVINLGLSFGAAKRLLEVPMKLTEQYATSIAASPFPFSGYMDFGAALAAERKYLTRSCPTTPKYAHPANSVIHKALWHACTIEPARVTDFDIGAQAYQWLRINRTKRNANLHFENCLTALVFEKQPWIKIKPTARAAWIKRMKMERVVTDKVKGTWGTVVDADPAGGNSQEVVDALDVQDGTFQWWV